MYWSNNRPTYDILIPKLDKSIFKQDEQEAAAYFEWFVDMIPERVSYVSRMCAKELGVSEDRMDCSPRSLLLLWKWFRRRAKTEKVIYKEYKIILSRTRRSKIPNHAYFRMSSFYWVTLTWNCARWYQKLYLLSPFEAAMML